MMWLKHIFRVTVVGIITTAYLSFSAAGEWESIEQKIREAKTPADHQAIAAFYAQEAPAARELSAKYLLMREVYAAARAMERKDRAGEHYVFIAKKYKYQEMAKEYETFAAVHKTMAEQLKYAGACLAESPPSGRASQRAQLVFSG
jgi:hypothetical protein